MGNKDVLLGKIAPTFTHENNPHRLVPNTVNPSPPNANLPPSSCPVSSETHEGGNRAHHYVSPTKSVKLTSKFNIPGASGIVVNNSQISQNIHPNFNPACNLPSDQNPVSISASSSLNRNLNSVCHETLPKLVPNSNIVQLDNPPLLQGGNKLLQKSSCEIGYSTLESVNDGWISTVETQDVRDVIVTHEEKLRELCCFGHHKGKWVHSGEGAMLFNFFQLLT